MVSRINCKLITIFVCLISAVASSPTKNGTENESSVNSGSIATIQSRQGYNVVVNGLSFTCDLNSVKEQRRYDYQYTPGIGTHKFHVKSSTFNEARKTCQIEGGHLAIVDSNIEELILKSLAARAGPITGVVTWSPGAWIGIHNLYARNEWVTLFNDPLDARGYTKWAPYEPNNSGGNEHCGSLIYNYLSEGFNDLPCENLQPFWCEIPDIQIL